MALTSFAHTFTVVVEMRTLGGDYDLQISTSKIAFPLRQQVLPFGSTFSTPTRSPSPSISSVVLVVVADITHISSKLMKAQHPPLPLSQSSVSRVLFEKLVVVLHRLIPRLLVFPIRRKPFALAELWAFNVQCDPDRVGVIESSP